MALDPTRDPLLRLVKIDEDGMLRPIRRSETGFQIPSSGQFLVQTVREMDEHRHKPFFGEYEIAFLVAAPSADADRLQNEVHAAVL